MGIIFPSARPILPANALVYSFDFDSSNAMKNLYTTRHAGTGAGVSAPTQTDNARCGTVQLTTGTTNTGRGCIETALTELKLLDPLWMFSAGIRVTTLATVAEDFVVRIGLSDTFAGDFVNGVYFEYERAVSTNWKFCSAIASSYSRTVTTFAATTNWINLSIYGTGTQAVFRANNNVVGGISTLPTSTLGIIFQITKSAGTTARTLDVDYSLFGYVPVVAQT